jgi:hypothetical protein
LPLLQYPLVAIAAVSSSCCQLSLL